jgi:chromosome segregation ATPase
MQSALHAMLQRLDDANTVIAEAEGRMSNVEARAEEAGTAQQCAEQQAAAAQCEVQQLREEVADLQVRQPTRPLL